MPDGDKSIEAQPALPASAAGLSDDTPSQPVAALVTGTPLDQATPGRSQRYDFQPPSLFSAGELRKVRMRHDEFARSLATRLSIYLRLEFGLAVSKIQTLPYWKVIESLPSPTHLTLFKVETLNGIGLLEIPPKFGLSIVDRLLGGPGKGVSLNRDLSEIESELLDQSVHLLAKEWCQNVLQLGEARPEIIGHETHGRFLQSSTNDTPTLLLTLEARMLDATDKLTLGIPFSMLDPLIRQFGNSGGSPGKAVHPSTPVATWNPALDDVQVPLHAQWEGLEITARELAQLKIGDVLPVRPYHVNHVQVRLANVPKFIGRLGTRDHTWAVELTESIRS